MSYMKKPPLSQAEKAIPKNPRYKNVKSVIDTGASVGRYLDTIDQIQKYFKYRRDEVFKRVKLRTFVSLLVEVAKTKMSQNMEYNAQENNTGEGDAPMYSQEVIKQNDAQKEIDDLKGIVSERRHYSEHLNSKRSTLHSVINGMGEMDLGDPPTEKKTNFELAPPSQDPYLLVDVRDSDKYERCRIISAENYPTSMLSRTMNFETKSLLSYKNQPAKIIILYDEDELVAPKVATALVQRGYENIYILSGGLKLASEIFPRGLVTGTLPTSCQTKKSKKLPSSVSEISSNFVSTSPVLQGTFAQEDLEELEKKLQELTPGPITGSTGYGNRTAGSVSGVSTTGGKPGSMTSRVSTGVKSRSSSLTRSGRGSPWK